MDKRLIRYFWNCGDSQTIEFAILKARLNRREKEILSLMLDECLTQEQTSERLDISTRRVQHYWYSACDKLLAIPWVVSYAKDLQNIRALD